MPASPAAGSGIDVQTAPSCGVEVAITLASGERVKRLFATAASVPQ
jgi:hypothetical protein